MPRSLRVAIEGCGHGTLDAIYSATAESCKAKGWKDVDLLIIGGDFQAVRNAADLNCMAVPIKYREIGDFHKYYSGERLAPYLTVFVGGNHEASNHLWELYYGGWVAPRIYYLGAANVVRLGSLRIAALSGIWKGYNYKKPHYERLPYNQDDVRSIYHVREIDTRKLLQIRTQVDVGISHDWPRGVELMGDWKTLFRKKDQFEADSRSGNLGSVAAKLVLEWLRPLHWFSAHLHVKYAAIVDHTASTPEHSKPANNANPTSNGIEKVQNEEEIELDIDGDEPPANNDSTLAVSSHPVHNDSEIDLDDESIGVVAEASAMESSAKADEGIKSTIGVSADLRAQLPSSFMNTSGISIPTEPDPPTSIENNTTKFLALDKCLPRRDFLQLLEIEPTRVGSGPLQESDLRLSYDPEWLAITRAFAMAEPLRLGDPDASVSRDKGRAHYASLIAAEEAWVRDNVVEKERLIIPDNFQTTAPTYNSSEPIITRDIPREYNNPQTQEFCQLLGIENPFFASEEEIMARSTRGPRPEDQGQRGGRGRHRGRGFGGRHRGGRGRGRRGGA